jgi:acetyl esterase/lipase
MVAGFDLLRDEGVAYAQALRLAGVPVVEQRCDSLIHGFLHLTPVSPASRQALITAAESWRALAGASPHHSLAFPHAVADAIRSR